MGRILRRLGFHLGEPTVVAMLERAVPLRLIRKALAAWKERHRRREELHRAMNRVSITPIGRGVMWSLDGAWIGRCIGKTVRAEIVLDVATKRTVGTSVTFSVTGEEVVRLLEPARVDSLLKKSAEHRARARSV